MAKISQVLEAIENSKRAKVATSEPPPEIVPEVVIQEETTPFIFSAVERVPSSWAIFCNGSGITANNNITGAKFVGSIERFNKALSGEE